MICFICFWVDFKQLGFYKFLRRKILLTTFISHEGSVKNGHILNHIPVNFDVAATNFAKVSGQKLPTARGFVVQHSVDHTSRYLNCVVKLTHTIHLPEFPWIIFHLEFSLCSPLAPRPKQKQQKCREGRKDLPACSSFELKGRSCREQLDVERSCRSRRWASGIST